MARSRPFHRPRAAISVAAIALAACSGETQLDTSSPAPVTSIATGGAGGIADSTGGAGGATTSSSSSPGRGGAGGGGHPGGGHGGQSATSSTSTSGAGGAGGQATTSTTAGPIVLGAGHFSTFCDAAVTGGQLMIVDHELSNVARACGGNYCVIGGLLP